jgi:hypothetical protein
MVVIHILIIIIVRVVWKSVCISLVIVHGAIIIAVVVCGVVPILIVRILVLSVAFVRWGCG